VFRAAYGTSCGALYATSAEHPGAFPTTTGWSGKRPMQTHQRYLRGPKLQLSPEGYFSPQDSALNRHITWQRF
jgi:hypothetical protein